MSGRDWLEVRPGSKYMTHVPEQCAGAPCPFHNPSDHHMKEWPIIVRTDRPDLLTERICSHGCGHPDPDSLAFLIPRFGDYVGIHGCCGCCRTPLTPTGG